jgi:hypothetical protein
MGFLIFSRVLGIGRIVKGTGSTGFLDCTTTRCITAVCQVSFVKKLKISIGPTYFGPLLGEVLKYTKEEYAKDQNNYTVLLILTDGAIHDMQNSIDNIVEMSKLPISIIIVGVGNADFTKMDQ